MLRGEGEKKKEKNKNHNLKSHKKIFFQEQKEEEEKDLKSTILDKRNLMVSCIDMYCDNSAFQKSNIKHSYETRLSSEDWL